jgi:predicted transcriptional regulator
MIFFARGAVRFMQGKAALNNLQHNWFKASTRIFKLGLDTKALAVYFNLVSHAEEYNPGTRQIAKETHMHRDSVSKSLKSLLSKGLISLEQPKRKGRNAVYKLNGEELWKCE